MAGITRGAGYCVNKECFDFGRRTFIVGPGDGFSCPFCEQDGKVMKERGFYSGKSDIYNEVRVEYGFDVERSCYREIARVRDESVLGRHNVYTLQSPLIDSEEKALRVAEVILSNLNRYQGPLADSDSVTPGQARQTAIVTGESRRSDGARSEFQFSERRSFGA